MIVDYLMILLSVYGIFFYQCIFFDFGGKYCCSNTQICVLHRSSLTVKLIIQLREFKSLKRISAVKLKQTEHSLER